MRNRVQKEERIFLLYPVLHGGFPVLRKKEAFVSKRMKIACIKYKKTINCEKAVDK